MAQQRGATASHQYDILPSKATAPRTDIPRQTTVPTCISSGFWSLVPTRCGKFREDLQRHKADRWGRQTTACVRGGMAAPLGVPDILIMHGRMGRRAYIHLPSPLPVVPKISGISSDILAELLKYGQAATIVDQGNNSRGIQDGILPSELPADVAKPPLSIRAQSIFVGEGKWLSSGIPAISSEGQCSH